MIKIYDIEIYRQKLNFENAIIAEYDDEKYKIYSVENSEKFHIVEKSKATGFIASESLKCVFAGNTLNHFVKII